MKKINFRAWHLIEVLVDHNSVIIVENTELYSRMKDEIVSVVVWRQTKKVRTTFSSFIFSQCLTLQDNIDCDFSNRLFKKI